VLYDRGASPEELGLDPDDRDYDVEGESKETYSRQKAVLSDEQKKLLRKELCVIRYEKRGSRKMEICIPNVKLNFREAELKQRKIEQWQPVTPGEGLAANFNRIRAQQSQNLLLSEKMMCAHLKESKYDALSSCLVDFKERANCSSVKNFQCIESFPEDLVKKRRFYEGKESASRCEATHV